MICKDCNNYYVMIMLIMIVGVFTETPRWGECCGLCGVCTSHQNNIIGVASRETVVPSVGLAVLMLRALWRMERKNEA